MSRKRAFALVLLALCAPAGGATAAAELTTRNSISVGYASSAPFTVTGTGCGAVATYNRVLPPGSRGIAVIKPKVGSRDQAGMTRVSAVSVSGTAVAVTVVADGPEICDPATSGALPGEPVNWRADYDFRAEYRRRERTLLRVYYESYVSGARWKLRPRAIQDSRKGTPRRVRSRFTAIRWSRFGGKKAVGSATQRLDYCRRGETCPGNGARVRLLATDAGFCRASRRVEYRRLRVYAGRRLMSDQPLDCS